MRRARRGLISDVISAGSKLSVAGWVIKDFEFNLAGPIFKSLKKDQNVHTIKGITHRLIPQTGFGAHHQGGQIRSYVQLKEIQNALDTYNAKHK